MWQSLRMHTWGGARALGLEKSLGSLVPGAHADLAVLGADPLTTPVAELESSPVSEVLLAGEPVLGSVSA